jgi:hypothetical protein
VFSQLARLFLLARQWPSHPLLLPAPLVPTRAHFSPEGCISSGNTLTHTSWFSTADTVAGSTLLCCGPAKPGKTPQLESGQRGADVSAQGCHWSAANIAQGGKGGRGSHGPTLCLRRAETLTDATNRRSKVASCAASSFVWICHARIPLRLPGTESESPTYFFVLPLNASAAVVADRVCFLVFAPFLCNVGGGQARHGWTLPRRVRHHLQVSRHNEHKTHCHAPDSREWAAR